MSPRGAVQISAPYYRPFISYNSGIAPPTPPPASQASDVYNSNTTQTFNFDAYVFPSITEDGRPRYRVRVGTFPARNDAERAATELRSERGLNPLVTPRTTR